MFGGGVFDKFGDGSDGELASSLVTFFRGDVLRILEGISRRMCGRRKELPFWSEKVRV